MGLALALETEPNLAAPTDFQPVPPRLVELSAGINEHARELDAFDPGTLLQAKALASRFPDSPSALSRLAAAAVIADDTDLARTSALNAIHLARAQEDVAALVASSQVLAVLGDLAPAIEAMQEMKRRGVIALTYAQMLASQGELNAALSALEGLDEPAALSLRGWLLLEMGQYAAAVKALRGALAIGERQPDVLSNLGYAYAALGETDKAYSATRQALHLAPTSRVIALNLVAYQFAAGDFGPALDTLAQIRRAYPQDVALDAAVADARLRLGDARGALKALRSARDRLDKVGASPKERAEILANTAFMEWRLGRRSRESAIDAIRKELLRCDYGSLDIGRMLARLLTRLSQISQLETLLDGLARVHPREALYELETDLAFMKGEFEEALAAAKKWAIEEPFEVAAAVTVTYVLSEVEGRYEEAARFGEDALRRLPTSALLKNNVAFSWALAGAPERAMRFLRGVAESPYTLATRGLARIAVGDIAGGEADYERAAMLAEQDGHSELATFVRVRRAISLVELGLGGDEQLESLLGALDDSDDPVAEVYRRRLSLHHGGRP